jgi:membrane-anchored protein YejM (alkaline phosphatase superfamily)
MSELHEWESFYVIIGSSAGALIGLQFVVMTLVAENPVARSSSLSSTFGTLTIIHFSAALLLSAVISAPWRGIGTVAVVLALIGVSGTIYAIIVAWRLKAQTEYKPVFEDWLFNAVLPLICISGAHSFGVCRSIAHSRSVFRNRRGGAVATFHRHSQRLGRCRVSHVREERRKE